MVVGIFVSFSVAYVAMGPERAFQPGSYEASGLWLVTSFVLGFIAAVISGLVCAAMARGSKAHLGLAGLVVVLGLLMAIPTLSSPKGPAERKADVPTLEAMQNARQPAWVAFLNPFVGAAGVLVGASTRRKNSNAFGSSPP
jgi:hypothetical protein